MNAVEIEEAISALAEHPFDSDEFPYAFLEAFGNKETTLNRKDFRWCRVVLNSGLLQSRCKLWKKGEPNCPKLLGVQTFSVAASMTLYSAPPPDRILTRSPHVTACRGRDVAPRLKKTLPRWLLTGGAKICVCFKA